MAQKVVSRLHQAPGGAGFAADAKKAEKAEETDRAVGSESAPSLPLRLRVALRSRWIVSFPGTSVWPLGQEAEGTPAEDAAT